MNEKELLSIKFLDLVKELARKHINDTVPYDRPDLFQAKLFILGFIDALSARGYEIKKKDQ